MSPLYETGLQSLGEMADFSNVKISIEVKTYKETRKIAHLNPLKQTPKNTDI